MNETVELLQPEVKFGEQGYGVATKKGCDLSAVVDQVICDRWPMAGSTKRSRPGVLYRRIVQGRNQMLEGLFDADRWSTTFQNMGPFWEGFGVTLQVVVAGLLLSLVLGTLLGVFSTTRSRVLRAISRVYVEFYQNTPLPVQVLFMYMAGPQFLQAITGADQPVRIAPFVLGFLGVGLYHAAYISEVIRTGIEAVPRGQMEAAQSQGFTRAQAYWYIVLPQTFKIILPPLCNQALNLVKNTSVLALVAGGDLMYRSDNFVSLYGYLQGYIVCCLMYFIICFPLAMLVQWLERRSKERPRGVSLAELGLDNVEEA